MDSERWERIKAIYQRALDEPEDERRAFVERECGGDDELAAEVLELLDVPQGDADVIDEIVEEARADEADVEGKRLGPYRLIRSIGRGGMGDVYLAERADEEFEQRVAIKVVSGARLSPALVDRFRQERQILANLDHPNVARLFDGGTTDDGMPYLVMEYVDGAAIVDAVEHLSLTERLELFLKICDAVQYAHSKLVVHRDLKPSNVLVTRDGTPKLLDFGIAKFLDEDAGQGLTRADVRVFTPEYASPEQLLGMPVTIATDVYGLGLMLYQVLSGELPFDAATNTSPELRELICHTEPDAPSRMARSRGRAALASRLEGDLDNIVLMALRKEPERRYETVRDLANDIRHHLERRPVLARAPSYSYRFGRFVSRNRVGVAATTAAVTAALAMTVFYTIQLQQERDLARTERRTAEAATDFMVDLFSINEPDKGADRDITAREVLDAGAKKLDEGLEEQPRVRARLLQTVGRVYERLGDYDSAQRYLEEGVSLRRTVVDPLDEDLIRGIENLAWLYYRREDWDRAQQYATEALGKWEARVGPDDPALSDVLNHLGTIAFWKDDMDGALAQYHRALALLDGDAEEIVKDRLVTMNNLAITYDYLGRNAEAQRMYRESLDTRI
ncbi:MAG TPA: serine/threonine-protein kinase, partial [Steroidobacteraceae bacterium]|nr:serine/threonine-protein kinase [Steroidobacteraceae bacterium]